MTQTEEETPLQLGGADTERDTTNDRVPFQLGDDPEVYIGVRPKLAVLMKVAGALNDESDPLAQAAAFDQLLDRILDGDSVVALRARLEDDSDDLDLDSPGIQNMFESLMGLWYARPTGKPAASRVSRSRTGRRSTVRSRAGASTP